MAGVGDRDKATDEARDVGDGQGCCQRCIRDGEDGWGFLSAHKLAN